MCAVGDNGTVLRYSYGTWSQPSLPAGTTTTNFRSVFYNTVNDIYVVGEDGTMVAYRGTPLSAWISLKSPTASTLQAMFAVDASEVFLADTSGSLYRGHSHWVVETSRTLTIQKYNTAFYVPNSLDVWAAGTDGTTAWRPPYFENWQKYSTPVGTSLYCLWGMDPQNLFAVGQAGKILHFDGWSWREEDSGVANPLFWIWGTSANNVFAVGVSETLLHWNGTSWTKKTFQGGSGYDWLTWVGGTASDDVWALGDFSLIHYNGTIWQRVTPSNRPISSGLVQAWLDKSTGQIFSVGYSGQIAVYDGTSGGTGVWTVYKGTSGAYPSGTTNTLWSVWGKSSSDVWAVGGTGTLIHWNGTSWSSVTSPTTNTLYCIWGDGGNNVYAVGISGTILNYKYSTGVWKQETVGTDINFNFVTGKNGEVLVTGDYGTVLVK